MTSVTAPTRRGAAASLGTATSPHVALAVADERLPEPVDAALYYDAAEALANAAKHAGARRITLTVARDDGTVVLSVSDDGVGGADVGRLRASRPG